MLQYLIIQLDDTSTSYCHYENRKKAERLISLDDLKRGILFAMKENLMIQYLCPDYKLPQAYKDVMSTIDHSTIVSSLCKDEDMREEANVVVFHDWQEIADYEFQEDKAYVLRTNKADFFDRYVMLKKPLAVVTRLNIVFTDVENFEGDDMEEYKAILSRLNTVVEQEYLKDHAVQLNLLTDRMMLEKMNNCNAGCENITLAPDGKLYVCPAFYLADEEEDYGIGKAKQSIGDLKDGLDIKNPRLYKLAYAPLCRKCDAYQCKRCVWLNRKMTYEINTPSHEQCVMAHLERNASRELLNNIRQHGDFLPWQNIEDVDYLDPFDVRETD